VKKIPADKIVDFVSKLHRLGWEKKSFEDSERILQGQTYVLVDVEFANPNVKWIEGQHYPVIKEYAQMKGEIPPIVIDTEGYIVDGFHRVGAVRARKHKSIKAYVPEAFLEKLNSKDPEIHQ
jgi:hypothetical protein